MDEFVTYRWSYDQRTKELDVWDDEGGRLDHYRRVGDDGYRYCAQGRIYPGRYNTIYGNRPMELNGDFVIDPDEYAAFLTEAQKFVEIWMLENKLPKTTWHVNY